MREYIESKTQAGWSADQLMRAVWRRWGRTGQVKGNILYLNMHGGQEAFRINPATRPNLTDRAKRYRAQNVVEGPRECVLCGSTRNIDVMHLSGNEDDGEKQNLAYGCRSCNGTLAAAFKRAGLGRPTNQYNPAKKTVPTYEQYLWAVRNHTRGAHDEGGAVIHATPKHKRIEYARRIAGFTAKARRTRDDERWNPLPGLFETQALAKAGSALRKKALGNGRKRNPSDASANAYERFHGMKSREVVEVEDELHSHEHLFSLGRLESIKVKALDGERVTLSKFKGALLCSNEDGTQMYVRGGDQAVDLPEFAVEEPYHDKEDLGQVIEVRYFTTKKHLGKDGGTAVYFHHLGEEDKAAGRRVRLPRLQYSVRDQLLSFVGGGYVIEPEGIRN